MLRLVTKLWGEPPEVPPISRGSPVREKDLTAGLGEEFSLDIPLHRAFFRSQSLTSYRGQICLSCFPSGDLLVAPQELMQE